MLPRLARLDRDFGRAVNAIVRTQSRSSPALQEIKGHIIHEGRKSAIRRTETDVEPTEMKAAEAETKIPFDDIERINLDFILKIIHEISEQFARQFSNNVFETIGEATRKAGLEIDAQGKPLTNELMIEILSKMHINFERSPTGDIAIVTAPAMAPTFARLQKEMDETPALRKRWQEMMERKRNEFREREINRNLAG